MTDLVNVWPPRIDTLHAFSHKSCQAAKGLHLAMRTEQFCNVYLASRDWVQFGAAIFRHVLPFILEGFPTVPGSFTSLQEAVTELASDGPACIALLPGYTEVFSEEERHAGSSIHALVLDRDVSILGPRDRSATLLGELVVASPVHVQLSDLTISGSGCGVVVRGHGQLTMKRCFIQENAYVGVDLATLGRCILSDNVIRANRFSGIAMDWRPSAESVILRDNSIRENGQYGVRMTYGAGATWIQGEIVANRRGATNNVSGLVGYNVDESPIR